MDTLGEVPCLRRSRRSGRTGTPDPASPTRPAPECDGWLISFARSWMPRPTGRPLSSATAPIPAGTPAPADDRDTRPPAGGLVLFARVNAASIPADRG